MIPKTLIIEFDNNNNEQYNLSSIDNTHNSSKHDTDIYTNDDTTEIGINKCSQTSTMNGNWEVQRNKSTNILKGYIDGKYIEIIY